MDDEYHTTRVGKPRGTRHGTRVSVRCGQPYYFVAGSCFFIFATNPAVGPGHVGGEMRRRRLVRRHRCSRHVFSGAVCAGDFAGHANGPARRAQSDGGSAGGRRGGADNRADPSRPGRGGAHAEISGDFFFGPTGGALSRPSATAILPDPSSGVVRVRPGPACRCSGFSVAVVEPSTAPAGDRTQSAGAGGLPGADPVAGAVAGAGGTTLARGGRPAEKPGFFGGNHQCRRRSPVRVGSRASPDSDERRFLRTAGFDPGGIVRQNGSGCSPAGTGGRLVATERSGAGDRRGQRPGRTVCRCRRQGSLRGDPPPPVCRPIW